MKPEKQPEMTSKCPCSEVPTSKHVITVWKTR